MREILFKGKDLDIGKWVYGPFLADEHEVYPKNNYKPYWGHILPLDREVAGYCMRDVARESVGQYTGIKDRRDMYVFEGDVVSNGEISGVVVFQKGAYWIKGLDSPQNFLFPNILKVG